MEKRSQLTSEEGWHDRERQENTTSPCNCQTTAEIRQQKGSGHGICFQRAELHPRNGADWHRPGGAARQILPQEHSQHGHGLERLFLQEVGASGGITNAFPTWQGQGHVDKPGKCVLGAVSFTMVHIWPGRVSQALPSCCCPTVLHRSLGFGLDKAFL